MTPQLRLYTGDNEVPAPPLREPKHRRAPQASGLKSQASPLTDAQRKAIFAIINKRRLNIDDIRARCPQRSISRLTIAQAATLLEELNAGTKYQRESQPYVGGRKARKPLVNGRRPQNVIAMASPEQLDLIDKRYRISIGWLPFQMREFLKDRRYAFDPSRTMDNIVTSREAVAVVELLKSVLYKTLCAHAKRIGTKLNHGDQTRIDHVAVMMRTLPPHEKLTELFRARSDQLAAIITDEVMRQRIASFRFTSGRLGDAATSCADTAELILYLEQELARTPLPQSPQASGLRSQASEQRSAALVINS